MGSFPAAGKMFTRVLSEGILIKVDWILGVYEA